MFVGSANGGVWRTADGTATAPAWTPVTDNQPVQCSSIAALTVSGADSQTVYAGCGGSTSSEMGADWNVLNTGEWGGVMMSSDGGDSWKMTGFPQNFYVTSIVASGGSLLVSARSHVFDKDKGGVWISTDGPAFATWTQVVTSPVFDLLDAGNGVILAAVPYNSTTTVLASSDSGKSWGDWSAGLQWPFRQVPFYPTLAISTAEDPPMVFVGALTIDTQDSTKSGSGIFRRPLTGLLLGAGNNDTGGGGGEWIAVGNTGGTGPTDLDGDAMPKDRMALLPHPTEAATLFVAGNGDDIAYRVNWQTGTWADMTGADTADNSAPHCDCRNFHWSADGKELYLVSDGGIFGRKGAESVGGSWRSMNGDIGVMEVCCVRMFRMFRMFRRAKRGERSVVGSVPSRRLIDFPPFFPPPHLSFFAFLSFFCF